VPSPAPDHEARAPGPSRFRLFLGRISGAPSDPGAPHPLAWPFERRVTPEGPASATIHIRDLHLAFPSGQTAGTRLVLTQSTYQVQRWLDWLDAHPACSIVADADRAALMRGSPETFARRGPWSRIAIVDAEGESATRRGPSDSDAGNDGPATDTGRDTATAGRASIARPTRHEAFVQPDPQVRLDACRGAIDAEPGNPALLLAFASTCMELQLFDDAQAALHQAIAIAPDWEAARFELGKLLLRLEDTEQAAAAFTEATRLMPTFAAAWSNLGAAFGELERPDEALEALTRALELDPHGHPILNNIGAVHRDEGRLDDAEQAFRAVIALAPGFVFGRYNLAHTLFLKGDFPTARHAYEDAFERDPQKNARQACRLAVARAASGDAEGASELLIRLCEELPREVSRSLMEEAESTLTALSVIPGIDAGAMTRVLAVLRPYSS
jgi:tetratricopeptide (TPR) repeat protein